MWQGQDFFFLFFPLIWMIEFIPTLLAISFPELNNTWACNWIWSSTGEKRKSTGFLGELNRFWLVIRSPAHLINNQKFTTGKKYFWDECQKALAGFDDLLFSIRAHHYHLTPAAANNPKKHFAHQSNFSQFNPKKTNWANITDLELEIEIPGWSENSGQLETKKKWMNFFQQVDRLRQVDVCLYPKAWIDQW
jgi:hypothetical protein